MLLPDQITERWPHQFRVTGGVRCSRSKNTRQSFFQICWRGTQTDDHRSQCSDESVVIIGEGEDIAATFLCRTKEASVVDHRQVGMWIGRRTFQSTDTFPHVGCGYVVVADQRSLPPELLSQKKARLLLQYISPSKLVTSFHQQLQSAGIEIPVPKSARKKWK
jgi:hypothetical protein